MSNEEMIELGEVTLSKDDYKKFKNMFSSLLGDKELKELVDELVAADKYTGFHMDDKLCKNKTFMVYLFRLTPKAILYFDTNLLKEPDMIKWISNDEILNKISEFIEKDGDNNVFLLDFILDRDNLIKICKINPNNFEHCSMELQGDELFINDLLKEGVYTAIKYEKKKRMNANYVRDYIRNTNPKIYFYCDKSVQRDPLVIAELLKNPETSMYVKKVEATDVIRDNPVLIELTKNLPDEANPLPEIDIQVVDNQGKKVNPSNDETLQVVEEIKKENIELKAALSEITEICKRTLYTQTEVLNLLQQKMNEDKKADGPSRN